MELRAIYGQAFTFMAPLISTVAAPSFLRAGSFSSGDFAIAQDQGAMAFSNVENMPTHLAGGVYVYSLTSTEMQSNRILYKAQRNSNASFYDQAFLIETLSNSTHAIPVVDHIADGVWDEVLTAATHNAATSAGRRLRTLEEVIAINEGTAQGGSADSITLAAGESAVDDFYKGMIIVLTGNTGIGQARACYAYNGTDKIAQIRPPWATNPAAGTEYVVLSVGSAVVAAIEDNVITAATTSANYLVEIEAQVDKVMANVLPSNFTNLGIEADGHVHADIKEWVGVAPLALVSQRPQVDVRALINSVQNEIADHVIRRQWGNVTDGDTEDDRSLLGVIAQGVNYVYSTGGNLVVHRDDDVTAFAIKALATSAVDDVVGVTPPA